MTATQAAWRRVTMCVPQFECGCYRSFASTVYACHSLKQEVVGVNLVALQNIICSASVAMQQCPCCTADSDSYAHLISFGRALRVLSRSGALCWWVAAVSIKGGG